ncbi:MAG: cold shock domain-containing protein [Candidatus Omnitrophica bacterium]|nr:cold shock domain-containing protein [Candidatus Omnitrophota bacterium]
MHTGKIKKLILEKGFGFIADDDGNEVFFHKNSLVGIEFSNLAGGEDVQFEVGKTPKGLNASNVSLVSKD